MDRLLRELQQLDGDGTESILSAFEDAHAAVKHLEPSATAMPILQALTSEGYDPDEKIPVEFGNADE